MSDEPSYARPVALAYWSPDWRHQWGKVANELEAGGLDWREAERRAFEIVSAEREKAGEVEIWPSVKHRDPVPFPSWEELVPPDQVLAAQGPEPLPPRPAGQVPLYGLTSRLSVICLLDLKPKAFTLAGWEKLDITKVTGEGWKHWHPVEPSDRDAVHAERRRRFEAIRRRAPEAARSAAPGEQPPRLKPPRRIMRHRRENT